MTTHLSLTGRLWKWPKPLASHAAESRLPEWLQGFLAQRGIEGTEQVHAYLTPSLQTLDDPNLMADMPRAVARMCDALDRREHITVYGDYDGDGVSATTVRVEFLRQVGAQVDYYIPHRRAEGYGLNVSAVEEICSRSTVLVTADCGVTASEAIAHANSLNTDVIVVDHHTAPATLPPALACLDPMRADCNFPFKGLCAAGVAFMLVCALRRELRKRGAFGKKQEPDVRAFLDVVALATVADMVPITGANRALLAAGLRHMATTQRVGLRALMAVSQVLPQRISPTDLAFRLGPRINARGRMDHAAAAVELLLTDDEQRATALAKALDNANLERRKLEVQTFEAATQQIEQLGFERNPGLVVYDSDWHPGVLGLVASRLVRKFQRPAVVIGDGGKGSGRTFGDLNLFACMDAGRSFLTNFGGHRAAAGLTIAPSKVDAFRDTFCAAVKERLGDPPYETVLSPDLEVDGETVSLAMVQDLERLGPFGQANPAPILVARHMPVRDKRTVGQGKHLKLKLGYSAIDAIGFNLGAVSDAVPEHVDVAFQLERNFFRGRELVQMHIEDLRASVT